MPAARATQLCKNGISSNAAQIRILKYTTHLTLKLVVRMPTALEKVWRYERVLNHMGYAEIACSFYHRAGKRFAAARADIDAQVSLLNCDDL